MNSGDFIKNLAAFNVRLARCLSVSSIRGAALLFLLALNVVTITHAQTGTRAEYEIKAALLYKLMAFVEWPSEAFSTPETPVVIGILGQDPSGNAFSVLDFVLSTKMVNGRKVIVKKLGSPAEISQCQVLFVTASEKDRLPEIFQTVNQKPIITVGETSGFANRGGHINLVAESNTVNLEINNSAANQSGLSISPQLLKLRLVKIVRS